MPSWWTPTVTWGRKVGERGLLLHRYTPQLQTTDTTAAGITASVCLCVCVAGLRQILTDVIEEVRESIGLEVDGGDVVHSLLNASWLQSLLKVLQRVDPVWVVGRTF